MRTTAPHERADQVDDYLTALQTTICDRLETFEPETRFAYDPATGEHGSRSCPRILSDGVVFEKAAVNLTRSVGDRLPPAATMNRPHVAGHGFEAVSVSVIAHPRNPFVPTTHANFRFFTTVAENEGDEPIWWFGGGFDLTPYYGFDEDAVHWHAQARAACEPFGRDLYGTFKRNCDAYFFLPHRQEARGIGGLFFDDWNRGGFGSSFSLVRSIADRFLPAYVPIVERRRDHPYDETHRAFQLYRRGRYVEFNLVYDRGTLYGLQSGRRIETVLSSMPPTVQWRYGWQPAPGSHEAQLTEHYLQPRDWLESSSV